MTEKWTLLEHSNNDGNHHNNHQTSSAMYSNSGSSSSSSNGQGQPAAADAANSSSSPYLSPSQQQTGNSFLLTSNGINDSSNSSSNDNDNGSLSFTATSLNNNNNTNKNNNTSRMILILVAASTAATLGYDVGIMASAMPFLEDSMDLNTMQKQIAMGSLNFVAAFGALLGGAVAQRHGRKTTVKVCSWLFLIGTVLMAAAPTYAVLILGRTVAGLGVGVSFVVAPTYLSEVAPTEERGRLNTIFDIAINAGILFGYVVGFALPVLFPELSSDTLWRCMLGLGVVLPLTVLAGIVYLPESPRWLVLAQQSAAAVQVLQQLGNSVEESLSTVNSMQDELQAEREYSIMLQQQQQQQQQQHLPTQHSSYGSCCGFCGCCSFSHGLQLVMLLGFWQQISGTEAVLYYSADFLEALPMQQRLLANVGVGMCKLIPELLAMQLVDKIGRRPLIMASSVAMVISMTCLAAAFFAGSTASPYITVLLLCCIMASFSVGVGPFTFLVAAESLSLQERSWGMTLCAAVNRCTSGVVALTAVSLSEWLSQAGLFAVYATVGLAAAIFYHQCVPEAMGKSLEEVAAEARMAEQHQQHYADSKGGGGDVELLTHEFT